MTRRTLVLAAAVSLAVVGAACSKSSNGSNADGGAATSPPASESSAVSSSAMPPPSPTSFSSGGTTVNIGGGEIPAGFPDSFPLPSDAKPVYSAGGTDGYFVWFSSAQSLDELHSFFDENLPANGWKIDYQADFSDQSGKYTAYTITGNGFTGGLYIGEGAPGSTGFTGDYKFFVTLTPA